MSLEFCNIDVTLGDKHILRGISGTFEAGSVSGLLGPNGVGKSTLLRTLAGIAPYRGTVHAVGQDLARLSARRRAHLLAMVPQHPSVDFHFPVRDVVLMGRHAHLSRFATESAHDVDVELAALEATDSLALLDRDVATLSGGERQLVFIAKAIAQEAPILLLDEPIAALDIRHQLQILALLKTLAADGKTVVAALHDLNLAARVCDHLVVLKDGKIAADGPPADVVTGDLMRRVFGVEATVLHDEHHQTPTVVAHRVATPTAHPQGETA